MPSIFFSFMSVAIFATIVALFTWYGSSVITIRCPPRSASSIDARPRTTTRPWPVWYACWMPSVPMMIPAVGKSGPLTNCTSSSTVASAWSIR